MNTVSQDYPITITAFGQGPIVINSFNGIDGGLYLLKQKKKMADEEKSRLLRYKHGARKDMPVGPIVLNRTFTISSNEKEIIEALKNHPYYEGNNGGIKLFTIDDPIEKQKNEMTAAQLEESFLAMIMNITDDEVMDLCDALDIPRQDPKLDKRTLRKRFEIDTNSIKHFKSFFQQHPEDESLFVLKKEFVVRGAVRRAIRKAIISVDRTGEHYYRTESLGMNYDQTIKNLIGNESIIPYFTQIKAALGEINIDKNKK